MNRKNFLGHLLLALTLILFALLAGKIRQRHQLWHDHNHFVTVVGTQNIPNGLVDPARTELLVRFRKGTSLERIKAIILGHHDRLEASLKFEEGLEVIEDETGEAQEDLVRDYRKQPEVEYAEPNFKINLTPEPGTRVETPDAEGRDATPDDPQFEEQWSLENTGQRGGKPSADISALRAWGKTHGSENVVVAVLDTGVDYTHPDLINNMWVRPGNIAAYQDDQFRAINDEHGFNAVMNSGDPMDDNGHGTHCAGIIGAEADNSEGIAGINWDVQIMPLKFMSANGGGTTKDAIESINYVIDRKRAGVPVRIISASWGSSEKSRALEDAIRQAGEEGILFVAASGNSSANTDKFPQYPACYDLPNVISVAAMNRNDHLASFSNYGPKSVHIAAPGAEILSTWLGGAFEEHSGTSMATPEVAGVAALVLAIEPDLRISELRSRLFKSVDPIPELKGKISTGGRINAAKAVGAE